VNKLDEILDRFSSISLTEMDALKLLNRTDTKFIFSPIHLAQILQETTSNYLCMQTGAKKSTQYRTLYYDTENLDLYKKHHNGELNRYKVRHRIYHNSQISFLEIKFKNNKGRTVKTRMEHDVAEGISNATALQFLSKNLPNDSLILKPTVWVNYNRITLVNTNKTERVTLDTNLEFTFEGQHIRLPNLCIAEIKQEKKNKSLFVGSLKKIGIKEAGISKYCTAIAYMKPNAKKNNFKEKLSSISKINKNDVIAIHSSHTS
jgi:hypothetical protein